MAAVVTDDVGPLLHSDCRNPVEQLDYQQIALLDETDQSPQSRPWFPAEHLLYWVLESDGSHGTGALCQAPPQFQRRVLW